MQLRRSRAVRTADAAIGHRLDVPSKAMLDLEFGGNEDLNVLLDRFERVLGHTDRYRQRSVKPEAPPPRDRPARVPSG